MKKYYANRFSDSSCVCVVEYGNVSYTFTSPCDIELKVLIERSLVLSEKMEKNLIPISLSTEYICSLHVTKFVK